MHSRFRSSFLSRMAATMWIWILFSLACWNDFAGVAASSSSSSSSSETSMHTNNWAVLVCTSRFCCWISQSNQSIEDEKRKMPQKADLVDNGGLEMIQQGRLGYIWSDLHSKLESFGDGDTLVYYGMLMLVPFLAVSTWVSL
ncbi:hypothetical protein BT93_H0001 [Corymbia citriodora subsp. variegata]|nr:hypothetical protein BT93_H0001 [Corymbia citriodora subsp. variegata]